MRFRPCIDIHNGKVKQLVGSTVKDKGDVATENFVSEMGAAYYANKYREDGLKGGHIIILNSTDSEYYEATRREALEALKQYPHALQIGGGVNDTNAAEYIEAGASHVIVTSYIFKDGKLNYDNLEKIIKAVGKEHLVLDLSCRRKEDSFFVVTDRWQTFTDFKVTPESLAELSRYCDEFLIHGVDVEGKRSGMDGELVKLLAKTTERDDFATPITYAGGISSLEDIEKFKNLCDGKIDFTIGSVLDIFGGNLSYQLIAERYSE